MVKSLRDFHDVELAAQAAAGGRREYGELVRRHGSAVRGLLRRMGATPSLSDDVAQDAFLQGFQRCAEFRGQGTFAGWIKKIAARLYLKRVAKEARYVAEVETDQADVVVDRGGLMDLTQRHDLRRRSRTGSTAESARPRTRAEAFSWQVSLHQMRVTGRGDGRPRWR